MKKLKSVLLTISLLLIITTSTVAINNLANQDTPDPSSVILPQPKLELTNYN